MEFKEPELYQTVESPMKLALELAKHGRHTVSPNPMVGAVIIKDNKLVGFGYHLFKGDTHAEVKAIDMAGSNAKGAKLYLNLEPCCHYGVTPPCVDKVIESGIAEVHFSSIDPNPLVQGKSVEKLKQAGIKVIIGELKEEAENLNEIFFHYMKTNKPFVIAKWAMTIDGKIATKNDSKWITNEEARIHSHLLRNSVDAILIGSNTLIKDNPSLNVRRDDLIKIRQPYKFILGKKTTLNLNIFKENPEKVFFIENPNLNDLLTQMGEKGITSLLVEGGSYTLSKFLKEDLINSFYCYIAPKFIAGNESLSPFSQDIGIDFMKDAKKAVFTSFKNIGEDILIQGRFK